MAFKISDIFSSTDAKSRILIVVATIAVIVGVVVVGSKMLGGGPKASGQAQLAGTPSLQSVPGGQLTPEYYRALMQANAQSAQQAQISGTSAVPTLVNAPTQTVSTPTAAGNCATTCPGDEAVNVADDINGLVRDGKLSAVDANQLLALAKQNVSVSDYEAALDDMVKQGKITPEQARKLLENYKKQHANVAIAQSAQTMDGLIKSGQLSLVAANELLALQKQHVSPEEYEAQLNRLVKEGKISPDVAAQLLGQYRQQQAQVAAEESGSALKKMAKMGQITPEVADTLIALQKRSVPVGEYEATLNKLVTDGKMTPATAAKLLEQYRAQRTGIDEVGGEAAPIDPAVAVSDMVASGELAPAVANDLLNLQKNNVSVGDYKDAVDKLVASGKVTPAVAAKLLEQYKASHSGKGPAAMLNALVATAQAKNVADINDLVASGQLSGENAKQLLDLQKQNASPQEYAKALDAMVKAGKLTPDAAKRLQENYDKLSGLKTEAKNLIRLQAKGAPVSAYRDALSRVVEKKLISPAMAAQLLQQYQTLANQAPVAPPAGVSPDFNSKLPGAEDFAVLQQRIAAENAGKPPVGTTSEAADESQFAEQVAQADAEAARARQQRIQDLMTTMSGQAQSLVAAWQPPKMEHKGGSGDDSKKKTGGAEGQSAQSGTGSGASNKSTGPEKAPLIKAGTILFAVLTTAVDSDYPDTPVMATIVSGEMKGAVLLGKLSLAQGQDKVSLSFSLMNRDDWIKTKTVSAFAIDPDTARTVLASNVDHHYMLRYGTMFASSFVTGYANGISQSGSTTTSGIFGTSSTHPQLSPGEKIAVGLGQVGTAFGTALQSYVNTPATVKVNSGVGLGILFMADVT